MYFSEFMSDFRGCEEDKLKVTEELFLHMLIYIFRDILKTRELS
jgi:hypothetical protein